jgi:hypothetical protein
MVAANMPGQEELVAVIPAPKEIDPRVLAWKGVAVLSKLDSLSDLWIQQADWVSILYRILVVAPLIALYPGHDGNARSQRTIFLLVISIYVRLTVFVCCL